MSKSAAFILWSFGSACVIFPVYSSAVLMAAEGVFEDELSADMREGERKSLAEFLTAVRQWQVPKVEVMCCHNVKPARPRQC